MSYLNSSGSVPCGCKCDGSCTSWKTQESGKKQSSAGLCLRGIARSLCCPSWGGHVTCEGVFPACGRPEPPALPASWPCAAAALESLVFLLIFSSCLFDLLGNHRWSVLKSELRWEIIKNETFSLSSSCKTEARVCAPGPWRGAQALFW